MPPALMLASPTSAEGPEVTIRELMAARGWWFEFKFDGIRALVTVTGGQMAITNRTGRDITYRYPDVVASLTGMPDVTVDGEIVCLRGGLPDFHLVQRRYAQGGPAGALMASRSIPAQFVAFDILTLNGADLTGLTYVERREQLLNVGMPQVPPAEDDGPMMWQAACDLGLEGLVAKLGSSRYLGKRSASWKKLKRTHRVSALVSGYDVGGGGRASTFGALRLSLLDERGALTAIGSVGSGFTEVDLAEIWGLIQAGRHPIVVEVGYLGVSPSGTLRQPVFQGRRHDVDAHECVVGQLVQDIHGN